MRALFSLNISTKIPAVRHHNSEQKVSNRIPPYVGVESGGQAARAQQSLRLRHPTRHQTHRLSIALYVSTTGTLTLLLTSHLELSF